jgi:hypothetical protein
VPEDTITILLVTVVQVPEHQTEHMHLEKAFTPDPHILVLLDKDMTEVQSAMLEAVAEPVLLEVAAHGVIKVVMDWNLVFLDQQHIIAVEEGQAANREYGVMVPAELVEEGLVAL